MPEKTTKRQSFILDWGKCYDFEMYDPRLAGFEFAVVESGIRGARVALIKAPVDMPTLPGAGGVKCSRQDGDALHS